jgi:hypothetical protein
VAVQQRPAAGDGEEMSGTVLRCPWVAKEWSKSVLAVRGGSVRGQLELGETGKGGATARPKAAAALRR